MDHDANGLSITAKMAVDFLYDQGKLWKIQPIQR